MTSKRQRQQQNAARASNELNPGLSRQNNKRKNLGQGGRLVMRARLQSLISILILSGLAAAFSNKS